MGSFYGLGGPGSSPMFTKFTMAAKLEMFDPTRSCR
jgi:hypothetical protein